MALTEVRKQTLLVPILSLSSASNTSLARVRTSPALSDMLNALTNVRFGGKVDIDQPLLTNFGL